jgi:hypothetical protein
MGSWWVYDGFLYGASFFWALNLACLALAQKWTVILSFLTKLLTATLKPSRLFLASHKSAQCFQVDTCHLQIVWSSEMFGMQSLARADYMDSTSPWSWWLVVTRGDSRWLRLRTFQTWAWPSHLAPGNLDGKGTGHEWMFPGDMHRGRQFDSGWYILIPNRSR